MGYSLESTDADCYEGTSVLINKLNIRNEQQLRENEILITGLKTVTLISQPLRPNFNFKDYREIHRVLFEDLYEWAGETRTISLTKITTHFIPPEKIIDLGDSIFKRLKDKNYFVNLQKDALANEVADLYHSLNMLHPFREGNGRTQRVFFTQLIRNAGYDIDYSNYDFLMIGTIQAAGGVMDNLRKFFHENLS